MSCWTRSNRTGVFGSFSVCFSRKMVNIQWRCMKRHYPLLLNNGFDPWLNSMVVTFFVFLPNNIYLCTISILDIKILQDSGSIAHWRHILSHFLHHNVPRRKYLILSNFLATGFYVTRLDACQSELQWKSAMQHGLGGNRILIVHTFNLNNCLVFRLIC
jgi:hypothetical protein